MEKKPLQYSAYYIYNIYICIIICVYYNNNNKYNIKSRGRRESCASVTGEGVARGRFGLARAGAVCAGREGRPQRRRRSVRHLPRPQPWDRENPTFLTVPSARAFETTARRRICRHLPPSRCPYKRARRPLDRQQYTVERHTEHTSLVFALITFTRYYHSVIIVVTTTIQCHALYYYRCIA